MNVTVAPFSDKPLEPRTAVSGKQMLGAWPKKRVYFTKPTYSPDEFVDRPAPRDERKVGFGSGKPMDRADLTSTFDVNRLRETLKEESRTMRRHAPPMSGEELSSTLERMRQSTQRPATAAGTGIAARRPTFATQFDRTNHVDEFVSKVPLSVKYERYNGTLRPTSSDWGEGCDDPTLVRKPEHARDNVTSRWYQKNSTASAVAGPGFTGTMVL